MCDVRLSPELGGGPKVVPCTKREAVGAGVNLFARSAHPVNSCARFLASPCAGPPHTVPPSHLQGTELHVSPMDTSFVIEELEERDMKKSSGKK